MIAWLVDVAHIVLAVLTFLVSLAELLYEGVEKAGDEKKKKVLADLAQFRPVLLPLVEQMLGKRAAKLAEFITSDKVASPLIDLLVAVFNTTGIFRK